MAACDVFYYRCVPRVVASAKAMADAPPAPLEFDGMAFKDQMRKLSVLDLYGIIPNGLLVLCGGFALVRLGSEIFQGGRGFCRGAR